MKKTPQKYQLGSCNMKQGEKNARKDMSPDFFFLSFYAPPLVPKSHINKLNNVTHHRTRSFCSSLLSAAIGGPVSTSIHPLPVRSVCFCRHVWRLHRLRTRPVCLTHSHRSLFPLFICLNVWEAAEQSRAAKLRSLFPLPFYPPFF